MKALPIPFASKCQSECMLQPTQIRAAGEALLGDCLALDHLAARGNGDRRKELRLAAQQERMRVAVLDDRAVGYAMAAPWFFGESFLAVVYVKSDLRGQGIGASLVADFEQAHDRKVFTSTNRSNAPMQHLLRNRQWTTCGMLEGLDEDDPEIFFTKRLDLVSVDA
jgi:GNAT superfamily N-acetyltransferase